MSTGRPPRIVFTTCAPGREAKERERLALEAERRRQQGLEQKLAAETRERERLAAEARERLLQLSASCKNALRAPNDPKS